MVGDWNRDGIRDLALARWATDGLTDLVVADTVDAFVSVLLNASTSCSP